METSTEVELRPNGQVLGTVRIGGGGIWGSLMQGSGLGNMNAPVRGEWRYEEVTEILTIEATSEFMGQTSHQVVQIRTNGRDRGRLHGQDLMGNAWAVQRL